MLRAKLVLALWALLALFILPGYAVSITEYQVKAVFLFNFAQFVVWPSTAFQDSKSPVVIGILGEDPFGHHLEGVISGEKVNDRPLMIVHYNQAKDIKDCHILFVSQSESSRLEEILSGLRSQNILTVGDFEGFAKRGGMVRFVTENNKIRFRINLDAVQAANLTISSKLLRPAQIIKAGQD